jgi:8-oxo-dGTP diphosphatase
VPPPRLHYVRRYDLSWNMARPSWFLAVQLTAAEVAAVAFGDEGEDWQLMPIARFLDHGEAIPHLQERLSHYLAESGADIVCQNGATGELA